MVETAKCGMVETRVNTSAHHAVRECRKIDLTRAHYTPNPPPITKYPPSPSSPPIKKKRDEVTCESGMIDSCVCVLNSLTFINRPIVPPPPPIVSSDFLMWSIHDRTHRGKWRIALADRIHVYSRPEGFQPVRPSSFTSCLAKIHRNRL